MSSSRDKDKNDGVDFSWGVKRGHDRKKDLQYYESFTYDGVDYSLYDSVYLFKEGELEPYIGKLIRIWENPNKARKVKVLWFFYPSEISNFVGDEDVLQNEIFLASGEAVGMANINRLERSRWLTPQPWEEMMKDAHDQGTLVLLQNLDPTYTSSEVEDIVWSGFRESCTAKMVQRTATSDPHSGQAFAVFKSKDVVEKVVRKIDQECLMLPNGRPLLCRVGVSCFPTKQAFFPGSLVIDKLRLQMSRESRNAVSTSHPCQTNTVEYEMAMEWRLLQDRGDWCLKRLYKQQRDESRKLTTKFKLKKVQLAS